MTQRATHDSRAGMSPDEARAAAQAGAITRARTERQEPGPASSPRGSIRLAVLLPCHNEEQAIASTVAKFRAALPDATIYVYDNASSDGTAEVAHEAGALVRHEPLKGKGNVVRRMFADIDADVYVLADGDDTYDAAAAPRLIAELLDKQLDLVNGARSRDVGEAYRTGHRFGNRVLTGIVGLLFGKRFADMLSGYKVLSRRFVKSYPALARGFEIETELTVHALELRMPASEIETIYLERPAGSASKLHTFRDGFRILSTIFMLLRDERPLAFFGTLFFLLASLSIGLFLPLLVEYLDTGLVTRMPTAILCSAIMLLAFFSLACGLILDTVTRGRQEMKRIHYLSYDPPPRGAA